jgi:peptide/nickel transport system substrate-binding protein
MLLRKRWIGLILSLLLVAVSVLTSCGPQQATKEAPVELVATEAPTEAAREEPTQAPTQAPTEAPKVEKVLVHARPSDSGTMDPAEMTSGESWKPVGQVFDVLVRYDQEMNIIPHLAKSWEVSDDGLEWTFQLRDDVKFHDGTPLNADAVVFTFERVYNEEHPAHEIGTWDNWGWYMYMVQKVEAIDEYTVKFTLEYPYAPFLDTMANAATSIVSPTAYMEKREKFRIEPVGSGPFKFVSWDKDSQVVLEKNPDYFLGEPKLDKLIYRAMPENTARLSALKTGEVHVLSSVPPEMAQLIEKEEKLHLTVQPGLNMAYLHWNLRPELAGYQEPFSDVRVREALIRAIDREALVERFFLGYGEVATNPIASVIWGRDESLQLPAYDPEKAKELLAEAGYPDGFKTELWPWPPSRAYNPQPIKVAEAIQAYWKEVGIDAELKVVEEGIYWDTVTVGDASIMMSGWMGDFADPDNFLAPIWDDSITGFDYGWTHEEFANLLRAAQQESDREKRTELYYQAQKIFFEELPGLPLFHGSYMGAYHDSVQNLVMRPDSEMWYFPVDLKTE